MIKIKKLGLLMSFGIFIIPQMANTNCSSDSCADVIYRCSPCAKMAGTTYDCCCSTPLGCCEYTCKNFTCSGLVPCPILSGTDVTAGWHHTLWRCGDPDCTLVP